MRPTLPKAIAAVAGFVVGLLGMPWLAGMKDWFDVPSTQDAAARPAMLAPAQGGRIEESAEWAATEWSKALATLGGSRRRLRDEHLLMTALLRMTPSDFRDGADTMLAYFNTQQTYFNFRQQQIAEAWMDRWLEIDAPGALEYLNSSSFLSKLYIAPVQDWSAATGSYCAGGGVLTALAAREPQWTQRTLASMKHGSKTRTGTYLLLQQLTQRDPVRAAQLLNTYAGSPERADALTGYVSALADSSLSDAFRCASKESPGRIRDELLRVVLEKAGNQGVDRGRALLDCIEDPAERRKAAGTIAEATAWEGREDIVRFIEEESGLGKESGAQNRLDDWMGAVQAGSYGPQAAALAEWTLHLPSDENKMLFGSAAQQWASHNPGSFQSWVSEHAASLQGATIDRLAPALERLARDDPEGARNWAETLPNGQLRDAARLQIALTSGQASDLAQAGAAYQALAANDSNGGRAAQIARVFVRSDGEATANWALQLPAGPARTEALKVVGNFWSAQDPRAAAQWIERMPAGAERDLVLNGFANQSSLADPEGASRWVEQVSDPALRTEAAFAVFDRWRLEDATRARSWLRNVEGVDKTRADKRMNGVR
jgi:hypothetical protein